MNRKAMLVEAGEAKNQKPLRGPAQDVRRLRAWMTSNNGGAWEDAEIETLSNPTLAQVTAAVGRATGADYAFVAFSGHGWVEEDPRTLRRSQKVIIGTGESIDLGVLRPRAAKCTMLSDACREVEQVTVFTERVVKAMKYARDRDKYTRASYREWYDHAIRTSGDGAFFLYGCSPHEHCYEDPLNGGYFTGSLIDHAAAWTDRVTAHGCLPVGAILDMAAPTVRRMASEFTPPQNPMGGPENRAAGNNFPFAVAFA